MVALPSAARRISSAGALALTAVLVSAAPAFAHVEVQSETPQALAQNVSITFEAEAESDSAGITEMRVVLPEGISPADVTLRGQPAGWKLKAGSDDFTIGGPPVPVGTNAVFTVKVRQLPDAEELAFKTIETYSDGKISRWIEIPTGDSRPEQPAPILKLKAAAPGASPIAPSPTASDTPPPAPSPSTASPAPAEPTPETADEEEDGGGRVGLVIAGAVVVLAAAGGVWWLLKRRSASSRS
ncbi:DUF1775 domain-containing protein [Streptomyces sp. SID14515]|uniref:DUF1775 domain-containing protein n=1 Tax=Streptomyces sp. SID14515 TaxID=2706074 RepID=UPI0013C8B25E|nr:DUF1775 domain-containing protein [Streptomyces sp. SID14515]NEB39979.1 DUF1775 domain-containing protein [Streptomyces sp. SID14515]